MSTFLDEQQSLHESSWKNVYGILPALIRDRNLRVGVEVGVAFGGHSESILRDTAVTHLYGVDSYRHRPDYDDLMNLPQPLFDELYKRTCNRLAPFWGRFTPIRLDSNQAANEVPGEVDFVYLDADHSHDGVWSDLCRWVPKVRLGGIIAGHDFGHVDFPGVEKAVRRFFGRFGWKIHVEGNEVWWVEIQRLPISFFMPAFNCQTTIAASVESILNGNMGADDELIIVDDASTDGTADVLQGIQNTDPRIRVVSHLRNKGGGAARNTAIEHAKHVLLFCLDSDNLLAPQSVAPLRDDLIRSGADAACFQEVRYFEARPDVTAESWMYKPGLTRLADYLAGVIVPGTSGNYLLTRESWERAGGYPEATGGLDTWGFGLRQLGTGSTLFVREGSHYLHRRGHESYWVRDSRKRNMSLSALQLMIPFLEQFSIRDVEYLFSRTGRTTWFEELDHRPIRVRDAASGHAGASTTGRAKRAGLVRRAARKTRRIAGRLLGA